MKRHDGKSRAFSGKVESGFSSENATMQKNARAISVSSRCETALCTDGYCTTVSQDSEPVGRRQE
jgi:hypothetical protein